MKNKLIPYSIILIFLIIFAVFYKSLKDTNIYTPETNINNDIPIFSAEFLLLNENLISTEIFKLVIISLENKLLNRILKINKLNPKWAVFWAKFLYFLLKKSLSVIKNK